MNKANTEPRKLKAIALSDIPACRFPHRDWGGWELSGTWLQYAVKPSYDYDLDLCCFTSSAAMLDMIMQVASKTWANNDCIAGLVRALQDVLYPQGGLCNCGGDHRLGTKEIERRCRQWRAA
jgi:hypothetical protein